MRRHDARHVDVLGNGIGVLDGGHVCGCKRSVKDRVEEVRLGKTRVVAGELLDADRDVKRVENLVRHLLVGEAAKPGVNLAKLVLGEILEWFGDC